MIFNHGRYWHEMENWDTCQILKATRCRWLWSQFQLYLPYLNSKFAWCFHRFLIMKVLIYRFFLNKETALIVGVFSMNYETSLRCVESWARHWVAAWDTVTLAALLCKAGWEVNWSHAGPCQGSNSFTNTTNTFRTSTIVYCTHITMRNVCCKNFQVGNN